MKETYVIKLNLNVRGSKKIESTTIGFGFDANRSRPFRSEAGSINKHGFQARRKQGDDVWKAFILEPVGADGRRSEGEYCGVITTRYLPPEQVQWGNHNPGDSRP